MDLNKINCRARYTSGEGCYEVCLTLILMLNQRVVDFEASDLSLKKNFLFNKQTED